MPVGIGNVEYNNTWRSYARCSYGLRSTLPVASLHALANMRRSPAAPSKRAVRRNTTLDGAIVLPHVCPDDLASKVLAQNDTHRGLAVNMGKIPITTWLNHEPFRSSSRRVDEPLHPATTDLGHRTRSGASSNASRRPGDIDSNGVNIKLDGLQAIQTRMWATISLSGPFDSASPPSVEKIFSGEVGLFGRPR